MTYRKNLLFIFLSLIVCCFASDSFATNETVSAPNKISDEDIDTLLFAGRFKKLDATANEFRKTDAKLPGGGSKLEHYYRVLTNCHCGTSQTIGTFEEKEKAITSWLNANPQSLTAHVARVGLWIRYAECARGISYANAVTSVQWGVYKQRLDTAKKYLEGIQPKDDPYIYEEEASIARAGVSPRTDLDNLYAAAIHDYPHYYSFYTERANFLQEKWYGNPGELDEYLQSLLYMPGGEAGRIAYAKAASNIAQQFYREDAASHKEVNWSWLKDGLNLIEKRYGFQDDQWSQLFNLAYMYNDGVYATKTIPHILKLADAGNPPAQSYMGDAYLDGIGVTKDLAEAKKWYEKSANQGYSQAQYQLGLIYFKNDPKDYTEALKWLSKAANQGNSLAQDQIGLIYETGGFGITQDYHEAVNWYQKSSGLSNRRAYFHLGNLYFQGLGVPQDGRVASGLMRSASIKGDVEATQWLVQHPDAAEATSKGALPKTPAELIADARKLMTDAPADGATLERAKGMVDFVLSQDPKNAEAMVELARYYFLNSYMQSQKINNGQNTYSVEIHVPGYLEKAEAILNQALVINPNLKAAYILLARIYLAQSVTPTVDIPRVMQAITMLQKADFIGDTTDNSYLLMTWAQALTAFAHPDEGAKKAEEALNDAANKPVAREAGLFLIDYDTDKKNYQEANNLYHKLCQADPLDANVRIGYSVFARMFLHDYDEAIRSAREAQSIANTGNTQSTLAMALYDKYANLIVIQKAKKRDAKNYFDEAHKLDPHPELQIVNLGPYIEESSFLKWIVSEGFSIDSTNQTGTTALLFASTWGRTDAVKLLLSLKANPNKRNSTGWTPLLSAASEGHADIVQILLESGADAKQTYQGPDAYKGDAAALAESRGDTQLASLIRSYAQGHK